MRQRNSRAGVKAGVLKRINAILTQQAMPPASWLGGLIKFLFKKGDLLDATNYRPVRLQEDSGLRVQASVRYPDRSAIHWAGRTVRLDRLLSGGVPQASLHTAPGAVSLHSSQPLSKRRSCMSCISTLPMHLTLWTTQRQLNALDVDLLHCSRCHGVVSRPTWPTCPLASSLPCAWPRLQLSPPGAQSNGDRATAHDRPAHACARFCRRRPRALHGD